MLRTSSVYRLDAHLLQVLCWKSSVQRLTRMMSQRTKYQKKGIFMKKITVAVYSILGLVGALITPVTSNAATGWEDFVELFNQGNEVLYVLETAERAERAANIAVSA